MVILPNILAVLLLQGLATIAGHQSDVREDTVQNRGYSHLLRGLDTLILRKTTKKQPTRRKFKRFMLDFHNFYRNRTGQFATSMALLRWNRKMAKFAQKYASKCIFEHNKKRGKYGENLYLTSAKILKPEKVVMAWMKEMAAVKRFSSLRDRCGGKCGHLTQVIWATTTEIGCGFKKCGEIAHLKHRENGYIIVVCNYNPWGNIRGKDPYEQGVPCSRCVKGCSENYKFLCNP